MATLLERADKIKDWNKAKCKQKDSGFHDTDVGTGKPRSPQNRGLPAIRDHVVAFHGRWEHTLVGDCATRVLTALTKYAADKLAALADLATDSDTRLAIINAKNYSEKGLTGSNLVIRNAEWNSVVFALNEIGIGVTVADEKESPALSEDECPR